MFGILNILNITYTDRTVIFHIGAVISPSLPANHYYLVNWSAVQVQSPSWAFHPLSCTDWSLRLYNWREVYSEMYSMV